MMPYWKTFLIYRSKLSIIYSSAQKEADYIYAYAYTKVGLLFFASTYDNVERDGEYKLHMIHLM